MGYQHIENLYKRQEILAFKRCYATEKVHGTSAHIALGVMEPGSAGFPMRLSPGGASFAQFEKCFDHGDLIDRWTDLGRTPMVIYGEAYGGSMQGMKATYGDVLRFIAFEVRVGDSWLAVPQAAELVESLGLEFVPWQEIDATVEAFDQVRAFPSEVAKRRGCGIREREGIVLRPPFEVTLNNGNRVVAKYKNDAFEERQKPPKVQDPAKLEVLSQAAAIAEEWVTRQRLAHVMDRTGASDIKDTGMVVRAMVEDVEREAAGEIVVSREAKSAIGRRAVELFKEHLEASLHQ